MSEDEFEEVLSNASDEDSDNCEEIDESTFNPHFDENLKWTENKREEFTLHGAGYDALSTKITRRFEG